MSDIRDALVELEREAQVRLYVYPKLVLNGKLTEAEAARRMAALRKAIELLTRWIEQDGNAVVSGEGSRP